MQRKLFYMAVCLLLQCYFAKGQSNETQLENGFQLIKNDVFWDTKDAQPIYSQGGGIFKFTDS